MRGTRPGEEAAGGAVMAVRAPGFSPFAALQETGTSEEAGLGDFISPIEERERTSAEFMKQLNLQITTAVPELF